MPSFLISWVPLYYEGEVLFLLWLQLPQTQGAHWLFHRYIRPHLKHNEEHIDRHLAELSTKGIEKVRSLSASYIPTMSSIIINGVTYAQKVATSSLAADARAQAAAAAAAAAPAEDAPAADEDDGDDAGVALPPPASPTPLTPPPASASVAAVTDENAATDAADEIVINGMVYTRTASLPAKTSVSPEARHGAAKPRTISSMFRRHPTLPRA